jgi:hypothetical protein
MVEMWKSEEVSGPSHVAIESIFNFMTTDFFRLLTVFRHVFQKSHMLNF